jgi:hypothetical protein
MTMRRKNPNQPIVAVDDDRVRFKSNAVVRELLDSHPHLDMTEIIRRFSHAPSDVDDLVQFYQLIGYSVDGFGEVWHRKLPQLVGMFDKKAEKMRQATQDKKEETNG